jgi:hypothetical protein
LKTNSNMNMIVQAAKDLPGKGMDIFLGGLVKTMIW